MGEAVDIVMSLGPFDPAAVGDIILTVPVAVKSLTVTVPVNVGEARFAFDDRSTIAQEANEPSVVKNLPEFPV